MGKQKQTFSPHLTQMNTWAFSLGTSVGWGSLVITSSTYLLQAGPAGSVLGLLAGAAIMLLIAGNYQYLINCFPEAGGAYAWTREVFGYDHGFLTSWFLALIYFAMLWANATALPLFARYFIGDIFRVGRMYSLFGYEVYLGEALLSVAAVVLIVCLCTQSRHLPVVLMTGMVLFFFLAILVCAGAALLLHGKNFAFRPAFIPDKTAFSQILRIACISPWAFIGFENISHLSEEFAFPKKGVFRVLSAGLGCATLLYIVIILLTVSAYPPEYADWLSYIRDSSSLPGLKGLPAFYAVHHYFGGLGISVLMLALLALVVTSLIGNMTALSRLICALARDGILPGRFSEQNAGEIPAKAFLLVGAISVCVPFLGRTTVGWIVDVTTIGATLIYGFVSASAWKLAASCGDRREKWIGLAGVILMTGFGLYLLLPDLFAAGTIETESWFLFVVWSILGFMFFRILLQRDHSDRFGHTIIVWIALLSLVLFVSLVWMNQSSARAAGRAIENVQAYYRTEAPAGDDEALAAEELHQFRRANTGSTMVVIGLFAVSLGVLMNNYSVMNRRARESERELGQVRDIANTDPLTGVKSKHAFAEREKQVNDRLAAGDRDSFAIAVCDVNGLKIINDTLGHKAGDAYILDASRMICEVFQHSPVFRIGGDEFAVFLEGRDYGNRAALLEEINRKAEEHIRTGEVVVSVGISEYAPGQDQTLHAVFERADALMYGRKKQLKEMGAVTR